MPAPPETWALALSIVPPRPDPCSRTAPAPHGPVPQAPTRFAPHGRLPRDRAPLSPGRVRLARVAVGPNG
ncbi:hypothetical protein SCWH03_41100 [Streptomyces pacificus]|uniref:Uncharacterized protein n=1 Tax=Streptomyces pacificus TaxID=2705029 RepID=A0A6A0AY50_9ACTN|nr:hypothetical protein SCWH03_41100 [Streptomyces pacificus]